MPTDDELRELVSTLRLFMEGERGEYVMFDGEFLRAETYGNVTYLSNAWGTVVIVVVGVVAALTDEGQLHFYRKDLLRWRAYRAKLSEAEHESST